MGYIPGPNHAIVGNDNSLTSSQFVKAFASNVHGSAQTGAAGAVFQRGLLRAANQEAKDPNPLGRASFEPSCGAKDRGGLVVVTERKGELLAESVLYQVRKVPERAD
jgi:hypothetical protein